MKIFLPICFLFLVLFSEVHKSYAQCDFSDSQLQIGQVLSTDAVCPSNGTITVNNVTGGGGMYAYEILDGPVVRIIQSQNVFNALPSGEYIVRVTGCNGDIAEKVVTVGGYYAQLYMYTWKDALYKVSGLSCGITNNGVYKLMMPYYTGGKGPFRFQISSTANFNGISYLPTSDSAVFTGLTQSTVYYIRVMDACNNFITFDFLTPPATPAIPLSVPTLAFRRGYFPGDCSGKEMMFIAVKDSASGNSYNGADTYTNQVFWGTKEKPYVRMKIEDNVSGTIYMDRNVSVSDMGTSYDLMSNAFLNGETGLAAPGTGMSVFCEAWATTYLPEIHTDRTFPYNANLKITMYFPGGNHCGTIVPAYQKTFLYTLGRQYPLQERITSILNNCDGFGSYFRITFNQSNITGKLSLVKVTPSYQLLAERWPYTGADNYYSISYTPLVNGETYRVVLEDACGQKDSMDIVYHPSGGPSTPPPVSLSYQANLNCPYNPNDTIYNIVVDELNAPYLLTGVTINGTEVFTTTINNWKGTGKTVRLLNKLVPPGTYTCGINWLEGCSDGTIIKNITVSPVGDPPSYRSGISLSLSTKTGDCYNDAFRSIEIGAYLKNLNTGYTLTNLRLISGPNPYVYPLYERNGNRLNQAGETMGSLVQTDGDSSSLYQPYSGLRVNTGKEGVYTFGIDIVCPDGTLVETITRSINVQATVPTVNYMPDLKYSNALVCGAASSQLNVNLFTSGGKKPYTYEYKAENDVNFIPTPSGGNDSTVTITPAPVPGTVYDIRVTDACGNTSSGKVTVSSFTGDFFIYNYPPDCYNNPFNSKVGTSWIRGAYYTWKRNGLVVAQGYDIPAVNLVGVTVDSITVDVNLYNCYSGFGERRIVAPNPCNVIVLPVNDLQLKGRRTSAFNVQINWKSVNEQYQATYFEIEKSTDGKLFIPVANIAAGGESWEHSYIYNDPETSPVIYYRLKIIDKEGKESLTPQVRIENTKTEKTVLTVSPNPACDIITLSVATGRIKPYKLQIYNDMGQLVKALSLRPEEISARQINLSTLAAGSYIISLVDNWEVVASAKFIKQ